MPCLLRTQTIKALHSFFFLICKLFWLPMKNGGVVSRYLLHGLQTIKTVHSFFFLLYVNCFESLWNIVNWFLEDFSTVFEFKVFFLLYRLPHKAINPSQLFFLTHSEPKKIWIDILFKKISANVITSSIGILFNFHYAFKHCLS